MNDGHMNGGHMTDMPPPPTTTTSMDHQHHHTTMHMTFFWGNHGEILFPGWPGSNSGMYALVLIFVFSVAVLVEFLSHSNFARRESGTVAAGLVQTVVHTLRTGLAYLVMLAVMSFNGGVFVAAVAGHGVGFLVFGTWVFRKRPLSGDKSSDRSPMICS